MLNSIGGSYTPVIACQANGALVRNYISALDVIMADSMHSIAQVTVQYTAPKAVKGRKITPFVVGPLTLWKENTPVKITYGMKPRPTTDFYGYVQSNKIVHRDTDPRSGSLLKVTVKYTLVGPSMRMQVQRNVAWRNVTASYIATKIAVTNQMKAVVDPSLQVFVSRNQTAKSDFVFLAELAAQTGFRFFIDNTTLYFINPLRVLDNASSTIPAFTMDRVPGQWEGLISFNRVIGSTDPTGGKLARRVVYGLNPNTKSTVSAANEFLRYSAFSDREGVRPMVTLISQGKTAESYAEAQNQLYVDSLNNRLWIEAKIETQGDPVIKPGKLVNISGRALTADDEGVWLIKAATHKVRISLNPYQSTYRTESTLGRDQIYDVRYQHTPEFDSAARAAQTVATNNQWRADHFGTSNVR